MKQETKDGGQTIGLHLWIPVILFATVSILLFIIAGFRISSAEWLERAAILALGGGLAAYVLAFSSRRIGLAGTSFFQIAVISTSAIMMTYAAATSPLPLADAQLLSADRALGYDWQVYASFLREHADISNFVTASYYLIFLEPVIIVIALSAMGRQAHLEKFILFSMLSLSATAAIFYFVPATQAWTHLGYSDQDLSMYQNLSHSSDGWVARLLEIRQGEGKSISHLVGCGLIAFPSYHCISAIMFIWGLWPIRTMRPTSVIFNLAMIAAAPIVGGHYLVDILCGALIAILLINLTERLHPFICASVHSIGISPVCQVSTRHKLTSALPSG